MMKVLSQNPTVRGIPPSPLTFTLFPPLRRMATAIIARSIDRAIAIGAVLQLRPAEAMTMNGARKAPTANDAWRKFRPAVFFSALSPTTTFVIFESVPRPMPVNANAMKSRKGFPVTVISSRPSTIPDVRIAVLKRRPMA